MEQEWLGLRFSLARARRGPWRGRQGVGRLIDDLVIRARFIVKRRLVQSISEPEHIGHVVEAGSARRHPKRRCDRAAREQATVAG